MAAKQIRRYAFTVWCDLAPKEELVNILKAQCNRWVFQQETTEAGRLHWQGRLSFKRSRRISEVTWIHGKGRLSIEHSLSASQFYATDPDKRVAGPWDNKSERTVYIQARFRHPTLRGWQARLQQKIKELQEAQDDRHILLVNEPTGNVGKSWMMKYLFFHEKALLVPSTCTSANDIIQFIASTTSDGWKGIIVLDIPRSMNLKHWTLLGQAVETLKNGIIYDTRYTATVRVIEPPQIVVFTNGGIPYGTFSDDRVINFYLNEDNAIFGAAL